MHMADALLSPAVGGAMTAVSAAAVGYCVKNIAKEGLEEKQVPMMGVMGAFVFAAQMVNFPIPLTGSSGHIGGGILLAALLGPCPALLTLASVLLIQCLFFADGGLLAYGCNVFNLGVCVCLFAYRFAFLPLIKRGISKKSLVLASVVSAVLGLQLGAFFVVLETFFSGVSELPFGAFALLMQPIHLAIGLVEGLVTAAVLVFIYGVRSDLLDGAAARGANIAAGPPLKKVLVVLLALTIAVGGGLSLFASTEPDGLEWSVEGVAGTSELPGGGRAHDAAQGIVGATAVMPGYGFSGGVGPDELGTSAAGLLGSAVTIALAGGVGFILRRQKKPADSGSSR